MTSKELRVHTRLAVASKDAATMYVMIKGNLGEPYTSRAWAKFKTRKIRYIIWQHHLKTKYGLDMA